MKKSQSSDYINGLEKTLGIDKEGNLTAGKNLEVDGTTKLNGGLKPIHHYESVDGLSSPIDVYFENISYDYHYFIGKCNDGFAIGAYTLEGSNLSNYTIISVNDPFVATAYLYVKAVDKPEISYPLANGYNTQSRLFTHTLTLTADKSYTLIYESTKNLNVDSIADLRTIMGVDSTNSVILPLCATDLSGTAVLQVTKTLCKIGTANVTVVSDNVKPKS